MKIAISSGHGEIIRGAEGILDEVDEARLVVNEVANRLQAAGVTVHVFHDDVSKSQGENLDRIVDFHNSKDRDLDVSVHFNAYQPTSGPMGTECLHVTQESLAAKVAGKISAASGLKNRGAKKRTDLAFLNNTEEPAILVEVCFVDSEADAGIYDVKFGAICRAICEAIAGVPQTGQPPETITPPVPVITIKVDPPNSVKVIVC